MYQTRMREPGPHSCDERTKLRKCRVPFASQRAFRVGLARQGQLSTSNPSPPTYSIPYICTCSTHKYLGPWLLKPRAESGRQKEEFPLTSLCLNPTADLLVPVLFWVSTRSRVCCDVVYVRVCDRPVGRAAPAAQQQLLGGTDRTRAAICIDQAWSPRARLSPCVLRLVLLRVERDGGD